MNKSDAESEIDRINKTAFELKVKKKIDDTISYNKMRQKVSSSIYEKHRLKKDSVRLTYEKNKLRKDWDEQVATPLTNVQKYYPVTVRTAMPGKETLDIYSPRKHRRKSEPTGSYWNWD